MLGTYKCHSKLLFYSAVISPNPHIFSNNLSISPVISLYCTRATVKLWYCCVVPHPILFKHFVVQHHLGQISWPLAIIKFPMVKGCELTKIQKQSCKDFGQETRKPVRKIMGYNVTQKQAKTRQKEQKSFFKLELHQYERPNNVQYFANLVQAGWIHFVCGCRARGWSKGIHKPLAPMAGAPASTSPL